MGNAIPKMEMLGHRLCVSSTWLDNAKFYPKNMVQILPPGVCGNSVAYILTEKVTKYPNFWGNGLFYRKMPVIKHRKNIVLGKNNFTYPNDIID